MVFETISSSDMTIKVYDGLYHEFFNELPADRARVFKDLTDWLQPRLAA